MTVVFMSYLPLLAARRLRLGAGLIPLVHSLRSALRSGVLSALLGALLGSHAQADDATTMRNSHTGNISPVSSVRRATSWRRTRSLHRHWNGLHLVFFDIASRPGTSVESLEHFITQTHWDTDKLPMTTPNPQLTKQQTRAVARYILSLRHQ